MMPGWKSTLMMAALGCLSGCSCGSTLSAKDLGATDVTFVMPDLALGDSGFVLVGQLELQDPADGGGSTGCFGINPSVVVTANGAAATNTDPGGVGAGEGPFFTGCHRPHWTVPAVALDGGPLSLVFTDSSGSATVTFDHGEPRVVTMPDAGLVPGDPAFFGWSPAQDTLTQVSVFFTAADAGTLVWSVDSTKISSTSGSFTFTVPSVDGGITGTLGVDATATISTSACTGFHACLGTTSVSRGLPANYP